ncbi:aldehyde dehydrogenase [Guyanagaster necrorhizus]|uniref:Aldehyde dehydrogenase n=1 Tax=Guyanagaster necrorhizus TaxID=856835 RepID=A0A9P7VU69_9AGAR|nr:aldehyde dehydrogenase [Guyanagaster necrorhizus MCA 3950]KAG7447024.1 aldehyde dehydrogenase [Guyanagaster necrorhizus MCA 3950]
MSGALPFTPLFINGQKVPSSDNETFDISNPYSHAIVGRSASATSADCLAAIDAAHTAFKTWEYSPLQQRKDLLIKAADILSTGRYKQLILQSMKEETAAPIDFCMYNWGSSQLFLRDTAKLGDLMGDERTASDRVPGAEVLVQRRAMGVIFGIAPWNAPISLTLRAIAVPILCGNTVVLKSSELSPRSQFIVAELLHEAGLPEGVLNVVSISREDSPALTAEIIAHPAVRKINFTGSDRVGKIIASEAAKYLKPCVFELGGKAPSIVLNDADIDAAAKGIVSGALLYSGQICMSTSRVLVQRGVSDALTEKICVLCKSLKAGDPYTDPTAKLSALFSERSAENVLSMFHEAIGEGAQVLIGDVTRDGSVIQPHVFTGVKPGTRLWEREVFGPELSITTFNTIDEAVELTNMSDYTLTSSLWTSDLGAAEKLAPRIRAGYANVNGSTIHSETFLGIIGLGGSSGYGRFNIEDFTNRCLVVFHPPQQYPLTS